MKKLFKAFLGVVAILVLSGCHGHHYSTYDVSRYGHHSHGVKHNDAFPRVDTRCVCLDYECNNCYPYGTKYFR